MKKVLLVAMFASIGLASNAKTVNMEVTTSCGEKYTINQIGDTVTADQLDEFKEYMDWVYCG